MKELVETIPDRNSVGPRKDFHSLTVKNRAPYQGRYPISGNQALEKALKIKHFPNGNFYQTAPSSQTGTPVPVKPQYPAQRSRESHWSVVVSPLQKRLRIPGENNTSQTFESAAAQCTPDLMLQFAKKYTLSSRKVKAMKKEVVEIEKMNEDTRTACRALAEVIKKRKENLQNSQKEKILTAKKEIDKLRKDNKKQSEQNLKLKLGIELLINMAREATLEDMNSQLENEVKEVNKLELENLYLHSLVGKLKVQSPHPPAFIPIPGAPKVVTSRNLRKPRIVHVHSTSLNPKPRKDITHSDCPFRSLTPESSVPSSEAHLFLKSEVISQSPSDF